MTGKEKPQLRKTTLNRDIEVLRHLLYWAVDEDFSPRTPSHGFICRNNGGNRVLIVNLAEEAKLIEAAAPHLARS